MIYKNTATLLIVFIGISVFEIFFYFKNVHYFPVYPRCPFYLFTGLFCPGCGSIRAITSMIRGNFRQAFHYNILIIEAVFLFLFVLVLQMSVSETQRQRIIGNLYSTFFIKIVLIIIMCFFILRNIPVYPFILLTPNAA